MKNELLSALTFSAAFAAFGGIVAYPEYPKEVERDYAYAVRSSARAIRASSKLPNENSLNCRTKTIQTAVKGFRSHFALGVLNSAQTGWCA